MLNQKDVLHAVIAAQREAAALILQAHGVLAETKTGHRDVVTEYDRRVQELLMAQLSAAVSGACARRASPPPTSTAAARSRWCAARAAAAASCARQTFFGGCSRPDAR